MDWYVILENMEEKQKRRILIIDDEEPDRKSLTRILHKAGYRNVSCVETGEEGIEISKSFKPDIILIDVVLKKGIDGFDVCKQIKSLEDLKPIVIMITGHLDAISAEKARHSGADEIVEKSIDFKSLLSTIAAI